MISLRVLLCTAAAILLASCGRDGPTLKIEHLPVSKAQPLAVPGPWQAAYRDVLTVTGADAAALLDVADPPTAAAAVRDGKAKLALTTPAAAEGLATREFAAVPLTLAVSFTFPLEDISAQQARDISTGRLRDWRELGGPQGPIKPTVAANAGGPASLPPALGVEPSATVPRTDETLSTGALRFDLGAGPPLGQKALRVDGRLPDEQGYPFVEHRVVAGPPSEREAVEAVAEALSHRLSTAGSPDIVLDAVGDIMLGRAVGRTMTERGAAFPFEAVQPLLAGADVLFGNLELPLTDRGTPARKDYVFRAPPSAAAGLSAAGFSVLSVANNHLLDYGEDGMRDTLAALERAGIAHAGTGDTPEQAHAPAILTVRGVRIALLAYVNVPDDSRSGFRARDTAAITGRPGVAWGTPESVRHDVTAARTRADIVIVSMHAGFEYTANPNPVQRELARAAIDAGAALVLGSHPHVLQGVEFYRGAPIIYSLGNFVFDLDDDDRRQPGIPSVLTAVCRITLGDRGVKSVRFLPAIIDPRDGRPVPVSGAEARPVIERLYRLTDALNGGS